MREFTPDLRDESLYAEATIKPPVTATDEFHQRLPESVRKSEGRRRWEKRFATPEMFQATVKDYYRLVMGLDREVGRILALLEERGLATNTVVVFMSDNGFAFGDRGLADKWFLYEESIRVPLVIADLRVPPGHRQEALKGNRKRQYSVRINDQWRLCFIWTEAGPSAVEIVDYH